MNCGEQVSIIFFFFSRPISRVHSVKCGGTEKVKTAASFSSLSAATATPFVLLGSGVIALFDFFET